MPKLLTNTVPSYRLHRQSGQAIVTLNGKDILLGQHGSAASKTEYRRLIAEWIANGRRRPNAAMDYSVSELIIAYRRHAESYYRHTDGTPTGESENIRQALRPLRHLYGGTPAAEFGPLRLKAVREWMIHPDVPVTNKKLGAKNHQEVAPRGWSRKNINHHINRIRQMFKWAAENEMVPASVHHGLQAVSGLKAGRSEARETDPVRPVPDLHIDAVLPHVAPQVAAMIRLQLLTGARPGELCVLRTCDIDTAGRVWIYRPHDHKTAHHGHSREIRFGPQAQEIIRPFLKLDTQAYCFSPIDADAQRRQHLHADRKTLLSCGNKPGSNQKRRPKRSPGDKYAPVTYCRAIARGCDIAFPPPAELARLRVTDHRGKQDNDQGPRHGQRWETNSEWKSRLGSDGWIKLRQWRRDHRWHPHQLRHNAATRLRREVGIDMARIILGHRHLAITEIYAEADFAKAEQVMARLG